MSEIIAATFPGHPIAVLSGPNHAVEVANFTPTATVIGASLEEVGKRLQRIISSRSFRAYTSSDIVGIEVGGALKNIFAIAAGNRRRSGVGRQFEGGADHQVSRRNGTTGIGARRKERDISGTERRRRPDRDLFQPSQPKSPSRGTDRPRRTSEKNSKLDADGGRRGTNNQKREGLCNPACGYDPNYQRGQFNPIRERFTSSGDGAPDQSSLSARGRLGNPKRWMNHGLHRRGNRWFILSPLALDQRVDQFHQSIGQPATQHDHSTRKTDRIEIYLSSAGSLCQEILPESLRRTGRRSSSRLPRARKVSGKSRRLEPTPYRVR